MDLTRIEAPDFDLAMTLNSGQVFHWEKIGDGFYGMLDDRAVYVEQLGDILKIRFGETHALPKVVARYFALDHPLEAICASFPRDPVMNAASDLGKGSKSAEGKCFHFRRPTRWPGRRRESCENAGWVIARRICWQQQSASRPERRISTLGGRSPSVYCVSNCASFPA